MPDQKSIPAEEVVAEPKKPEEFTRRGWRLHVQGEQARAEADFRQALHLDPNSVEAQYGLGLALKAQQSNQQAVQAFERAIELIKDGGLNEDQARATMLRHLSKWHIDMIEKGRNREPHS